ncbi:fimbrial protein [Bacteroides koreensis]|nr:MULTISPECIES: fimbrial protein [Bacteroides]MDC2443786.1 fimbrial protein [Bacteroides ovatus]MDC2461377.1 fimbrial protein [Bacteroides ovatus]MDC2473485.1 fimbrial protein [Bacteroides ovatus]MDC2536089.1 fimbrial protein [Bacteroides ovatus]MDC2546295.1 fimbrial protein [Bacteroides ovatus]
MRYKGYIWWAWLLLVLFSCTESEQAIEPVNPGEVRMSMNISTRATSDPEVLNANETRISRLRIYVFDGTSLDKMYYWQGLTATDGTYTTPVFTVKAATGKTLYAIVNEPVDTNTRAILESVDHPDDLVDVQYQMADYLTTKTNVNVVEYTKDYCLPMYGELAGVDAAEGTTQTVNMRVDRAVARVDVYMRKEAGNWEEVQIPAMLVVTGVSKTGFISPEKTGNYASSVINMLLRKTVGEIPEETSPKDKGVLAYSFYIPEMECKDSKLQIGIDEYDMIELGGDANNSGGAPLEKLERNHVYQLLCRFMQKTVSLDIDLTVCPWIALEPQVEEVKDIQITNCYVVPPGGRVHIPTDGVYKAWAQMDEFERTPIPEGEVTAEVLWQDGIGVMTERSVKVMNAEKRDKAYIVVETGNKAGNAVVAMKVNGEIYWSWHIWCTDYNPNLKEGQQELNGFVWMDRNLGATYNKYNEEGGIKSKGFLYQWGRKDLFPPTKGWEKTESDEDLYNLAGEIITFSKVPVEVFNNIPNSVHNSMSFYTSEESWYTNAKGTYRRNDLSLWNSKVGKKTIFDPCPDGWRVPVGKDGEYESPWEQAKKNVTPLVRYKGFSLKGIYYPAAGYRELLTGNMPNNSFLDNALYWAGNIPSLYRQPSIMRYTLIDSTGYSFSISVAWDAYGGSVRCVKE